MATYAPNGTIGETVTAATLISGKSPNRYHLMRLLRKKGMREVGEVLFTALAENTPSDTASVVISKITHVPSPGGTNNLGGVQTITAQEIMGATLDSTNTETAETARATAAADVTTLNGELIPSGTTAQRKPTEANSVDLAGNGGGGKQDSGR